MQKAKFGTIGWQDEMLAQIEERRKQGKKLLPEHEVFLEVQGEHNARILEGEFL